MRSRSRVWLTAFLFIFVCALIPSGRLFAQQATGAPASANAIDQLTAPIALYPDALVFQILAASTNFDTLKSFAGWLGKNCQSEGERTPGRRTEGRLRCRFGRAGAVSPSHPDDGAETGLDEGAWPGVHCRQETAIFDSIQRLRAQAQAVGNLKTTSQQMVETQTTSGGSR